MSEKIPDVIWAWMGMQDNGSWDNKPCPCCECSKFYRSEPVEALLKQARDAVGHSNYALADYIQTIEANGSSLYFGRKVFDDNKKVITAINKLLEETK